MESLTSLCTTFTKPEDNTIDLPWHINIDHIFFSQKRHEHAVKTADLLRVSLATPGSLSSSELDF